MTICNPSAREIKARRPEVSRPSSAIQWGQPRLHENLSVCYANSFGHKHILMSETDRYKDCFTSKWSGEWSSLKMNSSWDIVLIKIQTDITVNVTRDPQSGDWAGGENVARWSIGKRNPHNLDLPDPVGDHEKKWGSLTHSPSTIRILKIPYLKSLNFILLTWLIFG